MAFWISRGDHDAVAEGDLESIGIGLIHTHEFLISEYWDAYNESTAKIARVSIDASRVDAGLIFLFVDAKLAETLGAGAKNEYFLHKAKNIAIEATDEGSWDVSTASFVQSLSVDKGAAFKPTGLFFSPDGRYMYVVQFRHNGTSGSNRLHQYELSTPWDISTATEIADMILNTDTTSGNVTRSAWFSVDGKYFFYVIEIVGGGNNYFIKRVELASPWQLGLSTGGPDQIKTLNEDSIGHGIAMKSDGLKVFTIGDTNDKVYEYNISPAFDIETASFVQDAVISTNPQGVHFSNDGKRMFVVDGGDPDKVLQYDLLTAWDISTLSFVSEKDISLQSLTPRDLYLSPDGSRLYVVDFDNKAVYQYALDKESFQGSEVGALAMVARGV